MTVQACVIYLPADEFLRHPVPEPVEEPHQGGDFRDTVNSPQCVDRGLGSGKGGDKSYRKPSERPGGCPRSVSLRVGGETDEEDSPSTVVDNQPSPCLAYPQGNFSSQRGDLSCRLAL